MTGKLTVGPDGRIRGNANIKYNAPFPCVNGSWGSGAMDGVLMHTMVGNLPGTVASFNEPSFQASAHFGIAQDGEIWQFGPIGKGWIAWHAVAANATYYGIEHADNANPDNPLTDAQIVASAQVVECLSAFAGFPLHEANAPGERGYGTHYMGGEAWGGHSCPDLPPAHIRSAQRPAILALARQIRNGGGIVTADGKVSLHDLAAAHGLAPAHLLRLTAVEDGQFPAAVAAWLNDVFGGRASATAAVPEGAQFRMS